MSRPAACMLLSCLLITAAGATPGLAKDYLLTGAKPDKLVLVDPAARKVEKSCQVPDAGTGLLTIVPSPDASTAYAITNHWESVAGIDLDSCEQVFRADFSSGDERVKAPFGMDISPDGRELFVIQSPVRLGLGEYEVQPTRIAVYDTGSGVGAEPVRTFEVPRRIGMLMTSNDGSKLYALSWDLYVLDPQTGAEIGRHPLRNWQRENYGEPDVLDAWPQWDATDIFSSPYFVMRTDVDPGAAEAFKTGLVTLDLETGEFETKDFENTSVIIFSTVVNPVRPSEVYGVYTTLSKIDREAGKVLDRIELDHTYYTVNVASDGSELYVGGTMADIAVYDTETFEQLGRIEMPDGGDQALGSLRLIQR
ncbi:MAG TPA: quinohemoprotein amine dehydrogenase subunit beta [Geminicoccaceae bacterium]|nr:quinohemoprotein amine dehydrogenase subunit beta [Geminicoccaceae bacterium]